MNILYMILGYCVSIPARIKGMKFGRNSFIAPGYDYLAVRLKGVVLGEGVVIGRNAWIGITGNDPEPEIIIGDKSSIGRNVTLACLKGIRIGNGCLFSYNVSVLDHDHMVSDINVAPVDSGLTNGEEVVIEDECFIGAHSFILKGVKLGRHCVVGANSVVTRSFPAYSVIAGAPAKLIKTLESKG